jgi:hypothetical protein
MPWAGAPVSTGSTAASPMLAGWARARPLLDNAPIIATATVRTDVVRMPGSLQDWSCRVILRTLRPKPQRGNDLGPQRSGEAYGGHRAIPGRSMATPPSRMAGFAAAVAAVDAGLTFESGVAAGTAPPAGSHPRSARGEIIDVYMGEVGVDFASDRLPSIP